MRILGNRSDEHETMGLANLRVVKDRQTTRNRARVAIESYNARSHERNGPWPIPVCNGTYLDVDAILARSLPEVLSEQSHTVSGKILFLGRHHSFAARQATSNREDIAVPDSPKVA